MLLRWVAAAFAAIALAGLLTRLLPDTFPISSGFLPERVSFPLTYWNAMGIACALGALLALHLTASGREPVLVRVLAAAALAPIAVTLYLTFSRGAIWVLPIGFVLYVLLAQPRGLLTGLPAAGIPAAIAAKVAYGNELLARADYDSSAAAASQGRHVALVVLALRRRRRDPAGRRAAAGQAPGGDPDRARAAAAAACRGRGRAGRRARHRRGGRRRAAPDLRRPRHLQRGPLHGLLVRPALAADVGGRQRADRQLARRARRRSTISRCTAPAPAPTGSPGTTTARRRRSRSTTGTRCTSRRCRSSAWSGSCCCWSCSGRSSAPAWCASAGPSATPTARSWRRGRCSRSTPRSTGTGRCRRSSSGCSARAASPWRRASRGSWPPARRGSANWAACRAWPRRSPC